MWLWTLAWTEANFCSVFIRLKRSIARSRRRNGRWLFSTRLLAQRPTLENRLLKKRRPISCFSALPSSFIAARYERRPSVVIFSGEPWRFSVFFMKVNLVPLAKANGKVQLTLSGQGQSQVTLFDQGQVQILQTAVSGLPPKQPFTLGLATNPGGSGVVEPLAKFMTNPAGAAIVNAVGPIRQLVTDPVPAQRRYLVIRVGDPDGSGPIVQVQSSSQ